MPAAAVNNGFLKCNASGEFSFDTAPQNSGAVSEIAVTDESSDTTCFPMFATAATGDIEPKTGTNLTFNSSTGALTATTFVGALTGAVTGNVTGNVTGDLTGDVIGNISSASSGVVVSAANGKLVVEGDSGTSKVGRIQLNCHVNSHGQTVSSQPHSESATNDLKLPGGSTIGDSDATLVSDIGTQTLTNKTLTAPTITGAGAIAGVFTGNITGNVTGNVTGDLTGDSSGTHTGAVTGNVTGNVSGNQSGGTVSATSAAVADLTSGRVVLAGTSGELEDSGNLTFDGSTLTVTGAASVTTNLTIGGNLTVNGTTTSVNTTNTTIEDVLLELQVVDGSALSSDTNKDVGLVLNYYDGSAKKAAMYWDDSAAKFVLSAVATESSGVLTNSTAGTLEIGSLFINDCAGNTQLISCSGTTRSLENVTIDGGSF